MNETNLMLTGCTTFEWQPTQHHYVEPNYYQWQYPWYPQYHPVYPVQQFTIMPDPRIAELERRVEELERKLLERGKTKE